MSASPRLVVLVHGAWHGAWCWAAVQAELDRRGIPSLAVDLPGHGASTAPLGDLHTDGEHVAELLRSLDGEVVLVGHSYGGVVITEAACRVGRPPAGGPRRISHLVYLTAFAANADESVFDVVFAVPGDAPALASGIVDNGDGTTSIDPSVAVAAFYADCAPQGAEAATARLGRQRQDTFSQPVSGAPREWIESTYVRCTHDGAIPLAQQDHMAERCTHVVSLDTDHSPFLGRPVEVADVLEPLARAGTAGTA